MLNSAICGKFYHDFLNSLEGIFILTWFRNADGAIKGLSDNWSNFIVALLFHLSMPLVPLGFERISTGEIKTTTLAITASIYCMTIGASSASLIQFAIGVILALIFAYVFGMRSMCDIEGVKCGNENVWIIVLCSWVAILFTFFLHGVERYNKHVVYKKPFLEFMNKPEV